MRITDRQSPFINITSNPTVEDRVHSKRVEIQRLSWFDALFSAIKSDIERGDTTKAKRLADLGEYLAQDFQHYSEDELTSIVAAKEVL